MKACPTQAIRMRKGKAILLANRCIDCGECYIACPHRAIYVNHDDFDTIFKYDHRIALVPTVFINQFRENISTQTIYESILDSGFTEVFEVETMIDFLLEETRQYIDQHSENKPLISVFCPAIVRLIQVKFPALTENIVLLKTPMSLAAMYCRKKFEQQQIDQSKVGIFYISPCAAKIAATKTPVGQDITGVDGVINMDFMYNHVLRKIKEEHRVSSGYKQISKMSSIGSIYPSSGGEKINMKGRCLAIDGIKNAVEFLEKVENDELSDVDYLEMRACDQSCTGGILVSGNRFLTTERIRNRTNKIRQQETEGIRKTFNIEPEIATYLQEHIALDAILPRSMMKLDEDRSVAMKKMTLINELMQQLPGVDCGICGAPTCQALAEDIAKVDAALVDCVFWQTNLESNGNMTSKERVETFRKIWGKKASEKA
ncbi:ferredoxin [Bacteroidia bacterium]|nr:ferredoxin [Bacteroidia bacterium]